MKIDPELQPLQLLGSERRAWKRSWKSDSSRKAAALRTHPPLSQTQGGWSPCGLGASPQHCWARREVSCTAVPCRPAEGGRGRPETPAVLLGGSQGCYVPCTLCFPMGGLSQASGPDVEGKQAALCSLHRCPEGLSCSPEVPPVPWSSLIVLLQGAAGNQCGPGAHAEVRAQLSGGLPASLPLQSTLPGAR